MALASASGRLAGGIQTANPPTDNGDFQKDFSINSSKQVRIVAADWKKIKAAGLYDEG